MASNYDTYTDYLEKMRQNMLSQVQNVEYDAQSPSTLKSMLAKALRPDYDKAISNRNKTAAKNRAAIDTDAAARGMGTSTWVTDAKNRQIDAAASDIAGIEGDYISNLYSNLMNKLNAQEQNKLTVDQYNASMRQAALDRAQSATDNWWRIWSEPEKSRRGGSSRKSSEYVLDVLPSMKSVQQAIGETALSNNQKANLLVEVQKELAKQAASGAAVTGKTVTNKKTGKTSTIDSKYLYANWRPSR